MTGNIPKSDFGDCGYCIVIQCYVSWDGFEGGEANDFKSDFADDD